MNQHRLPLSAGASIGRPLISAVLREPSIICLQDSETELILLAMPMYQQMPTRLQLSSIEMVE